VDQFIPAVQPAPVVSAPRTVVEAGKYASFWRRMAASLLDSGIVTALNMVVALGAQATQNETVLAVAGFVNLLVSLVYYVYFIGNRGQTPGKMALKIKVVREGSERVGYGRAFIRETVGKFVSGAVFLLGYFWMLWDKKKQTWHDKMAGTTVVKI